MEAIIIIELTRFNEKKFVLNCDLIETVEETPDTVITLTSGKKYIVKENSATIVEMIIGYKNKVNTCPFKGDANNN